MTAQQGSSAPQFSPSTTRSSETRWYVDINGQWRAGESRTTEVRETGPSEHLVDETVRRTDVNGNWSDGWRTVTHTSAANGREQKVIESYTQNADGYVHADGRLGLSQRVSVSTTATADGGSYSVAEATGRNPGAAGEIRNMAIIFAALAEGVVFFAIFLAPK